MTQRDRDEFRRGFLLTCYQKHGTHTALEKDGGLIAIGLALAQERGFDASEAWEAYSYLFQEGLISKTQAGGGNVTPRGRDVAEEWIREMERADGRTPELEEALRLTEQQHVLELSTELGRIKEETRNAHAAKGTLRSGMFLEDLLSRQLEAIADHASAVVESYVRLAKKAGLLVRPRTKAWLTVRLEGFLSLRGFLHSLSEQAKQLRIPTDQFDQGCERRLGALRSRARLRLEQSLAEAAITPAESFSPIEQEMSSMAKDPRRVAVVHGRNGPARDGIFELLRSLDLSPVEWEQAVHETRKGSPYNREVVERLFVATQAVVVLLTGDEDVTLREPFRHRAEDDRPRRQARGNVFFEAGMAFVLHSDRTILVELGDQDPPSDFHGLNAVRFDGGAQARQTLKLRLETAGCPVRAVTDWLSAGADAFKKAIEL